MTIRASNVCLHTQAPVIWEKYCTENNRQRLMYKWAHNSIRTHKVAQLLAYPQGWLDPYFRPKKIGPLLSSLYRYSPPTATLSQLQEVTLLLNYVRTYLPVDRWDHEAIVKELRLDEDLVRKIEPRS